MYPPLESRPDILRMLDGVTADRREILERCRRLPADRLNDPVYAGTWSVLENLAHLAQVEEYMLAWIRKRPGILPREEWPPEPALELAAVTTALDEAHAAAIAFLKANPEAVLKERCRYGRAASEQTVGGVYFHLIEHEYHHQAFIRHKLAKLEAKEKPAAVL
jgi:uncharacterized damage-inducible protein DinB